MPQYRTQVDLRRQLGEKFDSLFTFSTGFHGYLVPEVFTKQGYGKLDLTAKSPLLRELMGEFKAIQGDMSGASVVELTELSKQIQRLYFADYVYYWKEMVNNIEVKPFADAAELNYVLRNVRTPASSHCWMSWKRWSSTQHLRLKSNQIPKDKKRVASQLGLKKAKKVLNKANKINRAVGDKLLRLQPSFVVNEAFLPFSQFVNGSGKGATPHDELIVAVTELTSSMIRR